jgi:hypothetical protein
VVFECNKILLQLKFIGNTVAFMCQVLWMRGKCSRGLGNSKMIKQMCTVKIAVAAHPLWMMTLVIRQQQNWWKLSVHNFRVINVFSTNFMYITLWNCGREAALPYSLQIGCPKCIWTNRKSSAGHQPNFPSVVCVTMKGRNFWIILWMVMRPGFFMATSK